MVCRVIERGVSMETLAQGLGVDVRYIIYKATLLDVCPEAADLRSAVGQPVLR